VVAVGVDVVVDRLAEVRGGDEEHLVGEASVGDVEVPVAARRFSAGLGVVVVPGEVSDFVEGVFAHAGEGARDPGDGALEADIASLVEKKVGLAGVEGSEGGQRIVVDPVVWKVRAGECEEGK